MKKFLVLIAILLMSVSTVSAIMPDNHYATSVLQQKFAWLQAFFSGGVTGGAVAGAPQPIEASFSVFKSSSTPITSTHTGFAPVAGDTIRVKGTVVSGSFPVTVTVLLTDVTKATSVTDTGPIVLAAPGPFTIDVGSMIIDPSDFIDLTFTSSGPFSLDALADVVLSVKPQGGGGGGGGADRTEVCHNDFHPPKGGKGNPHTISIAESALDAHLAHGDTLGACASARGRGKITGAAVSRISSVIPNKCAVCTFYEDGSTVKMSKSDAQQFESIGFLGTCDYSGCSSRTARISPITGAAVGGIVRRIGTPGNYRQTPNFPLG